MINFFIGKPGSGKSHALIDSISKNSSCLVILPDQFSFEYESKLYNSLGCKTFNNISTLNFSRLAETILTKFSNKTCQYADDVSKMALLYHAVSIAQKNNSLSFYSKQKNNFHQYLMETIQEIKKNNISFDSLFSTSQNITNPNIRNKLSDICCIYNIYSELLEKNNLKDKFNDISEAAEVANLNHYFENMSVYIDEFDGFSGDELKLIEVIISQCKEFYIGLRLDSPDSKNPLFFSPELTFSQLKDFAYKYSKNINITKFKNQFRIKSPEHIHLHQNIFKYSPNIYTGNVNNLKIVESKNIYTECESVCAEICRLVKDENYNFKDITVVSRNTNDYVGIIESCFIKYNIPHFIDTEKSIMHTSVMIMITCILDIISSSKFNTETILRFAKTQLFCPDYQHIAELENYCYKWNIQGDTWCEPFTAETDSKPYLEELRNNIISNLTMLKKNCSNATGKDFCIALFQYLETMHIPQNISYLIQKYSDNTVASDLKSLWNTLLDILESFASVFNDVIISPSSFNKLLSTILKNNSYKNPPHSLDAVSFSSAATARYNAPKAIFILGINEGLFPNVTTKDSLLSFTDRLELENYNITFSDSNKKIVCDENFILYRAVSAPSDKLYMSYPLSDTSGYALFPSNVLEQIINFFPELNVLPQFSDTSSPTYESAYYNYVQNFSNINPTLEFALNSNPVYSQKINYLKSLRKNLSFKLHNENIVQKFLSNNFNISATKFETYNSCHFKFFCSDILRIYKRKSIDVNSLEIGNLIHFCLETLLMDFTPDKLFNLNDEQLYSLILNTMDSFKSSDLGGDFSKSSRFLANYSKISHVIFDTVSHLKTQFQASSFTPSDYELPLSDDSAFNVITPNGISVSLNGKIDRVDTLNLNDNKYVRVIDYKKNKNSFSIENLYYGIDMQMLLYLFSITSETGKYAGALPAGALYMPYEKTKFSRELKNIQQVKNSNYKMKGILLNDKEILESMDKNISTKGVYIPVCEKDGILKCDDKSSCLLNEKQFKRLKKFITEKICDMTDNLYSGDISAKPFSSGSTDICSYCEYADICGEIDESEKLKKCGSNELMNILNQDDEEYL